MGGGQPFMYDPLPKETSKHPYSSFDPRAATRASLTPKPPKLKQEGPLVNFNQHPDSYLVLPYENNKRNQVSPSIKAKVKWTRIVLLVLRCLELLGAIGLLVTMILVNNINPVTGWLMRIPPGFAILHTLYSIYHLSRRASGRTPASSASYMLFAAGFDVSLIPFYAFGGLIASAQYKITLDGPGQDGEWSSLLPAGQSAAKILSGTAFLCSVIAGGLHVISLGLSIWLAVTFRKITKLPPDMNPLENNLTSRHHKRNKSSMSASTISEKRLSEPLENKRSSGAPYEDVSRPPTIPFMHTRQGSTDSFSTYRTTPPGSRDSRLDLPSRQYQLQSQSASARSSIVDLKRSSGPYNASPQPPKRSSYASIPTSENSPYRSSRHSDNISEAWHTAESLPATQRSSRSSTPKKSSYQALHQRPDAEEEDISISFPISHPNPLEANPPAPRLPAHRSDRSSALSEISYNHGAPAPSSGDLADHSISVARAREQAANKPAPFQQQENFKSRFYGDLKPATPPILVGSSGRGAGRQVSSGNDFGGSKSARAFGRRDVSGKVAEEGRSIAGNGTWGTRFRKISGLGGSAH